MNIKRIISTSCMSLLLMSSACASELPLNIKNYILQTYPKALIRFDGLITLPDKTRYLPVYPAISDINATTGIKYSLPKNTTLKDKPDILIFNNNFTLLKITQEQTGEATVVELDEYPMALKTGMLPQDLVVPTGLILPESLSNILGNLAIPLYEQNTNDKNNKTTKKNKNITLYPNAKTSSLVGQIESNKVIHDTNTQKTTVSTKTDKPNKVIPKNYLPHPLQNKRYLISNLEMTDISVVPSYAIEPSFTLKLNAMINDVKVTSNENYVLVTKANNTSVDVIDMHNEQIIKHIELDTQPNEIYITDDNKQAFITARNDKSIFVIDLKNFKLTKKIIVAGAPEKLIFVNDNKTLIYYDKISSNLYAVELSDKYNNYLIDNFPNASGFVYKDDIIYATLRTQNKLVLKEFNINNIISKDKKEKEDKKEIKKQEQKEFVNNNKGSDSVLTMNLPTIVNYPGKKIKKSTKRGTINNEILPLTPQEIIDEAETRFIKTLQLDEKPVDITSYNNKLFILCAKNNTINVFDMNNYSLVNTIKLPIQGFAKSIFPVKSTNLAIITNVMEKKYLILDMARQEIIQVVPISIPINKILILKDK